MAGAAPADGTDAFGAYCRRQDQARRRQGRLHHPEGRREGRPAPTGSSTRRTTRTSGSCPATRRSTRREGDAEDYAVIHYHRPDGDYGDGLDDFVTSGACTSGPAPRPRPCGRSRSGPTGRTLRRRLRVPLVDGAHRAELHPPPGRHEGSRPRPDPRPRTLRPRGRGSCPGRRTRQAASTCCPLGGGAGADADLTGSRADVADRGHVAWKVAAGGRGTRTRCALRAATAGSTRRRASPAGRRSRSTRARRAAGRARARFPHLADYAAFRVARRRPRRVPAR